MLAAAGADDPAGTLRPLLTAALDNALEQGDAALTGPIVRGDVDTVRAHLAEIARQRAAHAAVVRRPGAGPPSTGPSPTAGCCRSGPLKIREVLDAAAASRPRVPPASPGRCDDRRPSVARTRAELADAARRARGRPASGSGSCRRWAPSTRATPACSGSPASRVGDGPVVVVDLRQPAPVRRRRGPRPLPAHPRRRPQGLRARGRRHRVRAERRRGLPRRRTPQVTVEPGPAGDGPRGPDPARPLPRRADRGRQAVRPGPPRRRGLRGEGLPAARADPADGRRPLPRRRGRRRRDRARARRPGAVQPQPLPRRRAAPRRPRCSAAPCAPPRRAAQLRPATPRSTPPGPSCAPPTAVDLDYLVVTDPDLGDAARPTYPPDRGPDPDRRPGRHHPPDRQPAARHRVAPSRGKEDS